MDDNIKFYSGINELRTLVVKGFNIYNIIDKFQTVFENFHEINFIKGVEKDVILRTNIGIVFDTLFKQKPLKNKEELDYLNSKCLNILIDSKYPKTKLYIFHLYLGNKKLDEKWNILLHSTIEEQHSFIYQSIKEGKFLEKIKYRSIDLEKYLNKDRKFKNLNLLEEVLSIWLCASYPFNISLEKIFNYIYNNYQIKVDNTLMKDKIHPISIKRNRLEILPKEIKESLNLNIYKIIINKRKNISFDLNTEDYYKLNLAMENAKNLCNFGSFYLKNGKKSNNVDELLKEYCLEPYIQNIMTPFFDYKHNNSKSLQSRSFWLNLDLNLTLKVKSQKNLEKTNKIIKI